MDTIAIIGGGFSGTLLAIHLLRSRPVNPFLVCLIEKSGKQARGAAYSTTCPLHLLNVPASNMSAFPDDPDHFLRWVQTVDPAIQPSTFVSRSLYGDYLEMLLNHARLSRPANVQFNQLPDEATQIERLPDSRLSISFKNGGGLIADKVILATGNFPPKDHPEMPQSLTTDHRYINDPWADGEFDVLSEGDDVLLIGTGLTMVDKALQLIDRGYKRTIYAVSRHGLLPRAHDLSSTPCPVQAASPADATSARALLSSVRALIADEKNQFDPDFGKLDWRAVIDSLRPVSQELWQALPLVEKRRFIRHVRPYWDVHRHRMANAVAENIETLRKQHRLQIFAGRITSCEPLLDSLRVGFTMRGSKSEACFGVGAVINCTGPSQDYRSIKTPLIDNLRNNGFLTSHATSLGLSVADSGALIESSGEVSERLYTLGSPRLGQLGETTAVPEIREQASRLSSLLLSDFNAARKPQAIKIPETGGGNKR